ncbi:hypothetical protein SDRG_01267 [Saprolegnia diclina VS20]|uniref:Uncharacterized protein n=1 Tax=Saprolegnia diclina (strain VS20) TaxID=1156394 RepID=T0SEE9_SAPDV|nr:hypothetical protein SDRG_01267 [Saprolegnia diclina VS20]EQC41292.1 hypothetical protein SDRG_01267 [Saprolegnia diclina VS20]|eukprot:XP_008605006.1 hypothetical protein SDRG_01267 [Saprolegnia diclina VS20]
MLVTRVLPYDDPTRQSQQAWKLGSGLVLALVYLALATLVALSTYTLSTIANTPLFMGLNLQTFTSNQFNVPINVVLKGETALPLASTQPLDATLSLSTLLYKLCKKDDQACAASFLPSSNEIWRSVVKALALIPSFDQPLFQDPTQTVVISHINNLSGWNKPMAQMYISGHDMAITCMVRRASFYVATSSPSTAVIDSVVFCSQRKFDPNWVCENDVSEDANTYALRIGKGEARYLGVAPRSDVYMNPGYLATFRNEAATVRLNTLTFFDEYQYGMLRTFAPWDLLPAVSCATFNTETGLGWLFMCKGLVTMIWESDALMLSNSAVLWLLTAYLVALQLVFLRHSAICSVPVYMSKTVVGLAILFVSFYGNMNLQALTTYLSMKPSAETPKYYKWLGAAQLASIVGIMTGPLIQMWFNPRLVTQTWLLLVFSLVNWSLVFVLEAFVFPARSRIVPGPCYHASSSNCFAFDAIAHTYYASAIASASVVIVAILCVNVHSSYCKRDKVKAAATNSVLGYLEISDLSSVLTSPHGLLVSTADGAIGIDHGVLLVKNMLQVSDMVLTRTSNVQYELIYRLLPTTFLRTLFSRSIGSIRIVSVDRTRILRQSSFKHLHEMDLGSRHWSPYFT